MSPTRIQRKRTKGWRMPEGAVYVGRPTKWGNPYGVTHCDAVHIPRRHWHVHHVDCLRWLETTSDKRSAIGYAVDRYRESLGDWFSRHTIRDELAGRDLVCWCPLDQPCHADVLLEVANR